MSAPLDPLFTSNAKAPMLPRTERERQRQQERGQLQQWLAVERHVPKDWHQLSNSRRRKLAKAERERAWRKWLRHRLRKAHGKHPGMRVLGEEFHQFLLEHKPWLTKRRKGEQRPAWQLHSAVLKQAGVTERPS